MKNLFWLIVFAATMAANAQVIIEHHDPPPNVLNITDFSPQSQSVISDPYRIINGETQKVDATWLAVSGEVVQVHPNEGLRIEGSIEGVGRSSDFFVVNLPVSAAEHEMVPPKGYVLLVKDVGTYTYSTAAGSTRTIRKYDYGIPWTPPPLTPEQIAE